MHLAQIGGITSPSTIFTDANTLPSVFVGRILIFAVSIAGFIFLLRLIISGFNLLTANGDQGKVQSATKGLTTGITGLIIVISAYFLAQIIQYIFGLKVL